MDRAYWNREVRKCIELRKFAFEGETEMIEVESNVPMPKVRRKAGEAPAAVVKAMKEYAAAYKALHGVSVLGIEYRNGYIYVEGTQGVSLSIFRQRIKQLRYRKG